VEQLEQPWSERVEEVIKQSVELAKTGDKEQVLVFLDGALAEVTPENRGDSWTQVLCRHAAVLANAMGDRRREIRYTEQALPYAKDYRFAVYNFARLLLRDGQVYLAERHATEAYKLSLAGGNRSDRDLVAAILKQWPNIG
jgi:hypothetical protein